MELETGELIKLCAVDSDMFGKTFFPKAFRQYSPSYMGRVWAALENPSYRYLNLRIMRGGSKTTTLRTFTAKRIAYGISRTVLYIGASESHAIRSVEWLRSRIEPRLGKEGVLKPTEFGATFGLRPGKKWQAHEIEVYHGVDEYPIWILAVGITGNIRGINFDDYRPDLIILDDPITDENAITMEQCNKISDLIMGAVANSLASPVDEPNSKMVMLQTPISPNDASARASASQEWHTECFGCWTPETEDLSVDDQRSSWEDMFPTSTLRGQKIASITEGRYSVFAREMEVKLVSAETLSFRPNWLRFYEEPPQRGTCVISVDPVPPPSDTSLARGLKGRDEEAIAVLCRSKGDYYVLDYAVSKGHEPNWTANKVIEFALRYKPLCVVVETVAYQRVLKWLLEKEMARRGRYWPVKGTPNDKRKKFIRITTTLSGIASAGKLWCAKHHDQFVLQFESYGIGYRGMDDLLDAVAIGVSELTAPYLELDVDLSDEDVEPLELKRLCP